MEMTVNNQHSLEFYFKEYYGRLYTLAFRMAGNHEDAEDVLQTAFVSALQGYDKFRGESSIHTWLYRIVANAAARFHKSGRKLPITLFSEELGVPEDVLYGKICSHGRVEDAALEMVTRESCLQMFMNCMPSKYRVIYTLRGILKLTVDETAEILAISRAAVKTRLHRAKKLSRDHMEGRCSLVNPGAPCDCRGYAAYLQKKDKITRLLDIRVVREKERGAVREFRKELSIVDQITGLYNSRLVPPDYPVFFERVKDLCKESGLRILETG